VVISPRRLCVKDCRCSFRSGCVIRLFSGQRNFAFLTFSIRSLGFFSPRKEIASNSFSGEFSSYSRMQNPRAVSPPVLIFVLSYFSHVLPVSHPQLRERLASCRPAPCPSSMTMRLSFSYPPFLLVKTEKTLFGFSVSALSSFNAGEDSFPFYKFRYDSRPLLSSFPPLRLPRNFFLPRISVPVVMQLSASRPTRWSDASRHGDIYHGAFSH